MYVLIPRNTAHRSDPLHNRPSELSRQPSSVRDSLQLSQETHVHHPQFEFRVSITIRMMKDDDQVLLLIAFNRTHQWLMLSMTRLLHDYEVAHITSHHITDVSDRLTSG